MQIQQQEQQQERIPMGIIWDIFIFDDYIIENIIIPKVLQSLYHSKNTTTTTTTTTTVATNNNVNELVKCQCQKEIVTIVVTGIVQWIVLHMYSTSSNYSTSSTSRYTVNHDDNNSNTRSIPILKSELASSTTSTPGMKLFDISVSISTLSSNTVRLYYAILLRIGIPMIYNLFKVWLTFRLQQFHTEQTVTTTIPSNHQVVEQEEQQIIIQQKLIQKRTKLIQQFVQRYGDGIIVPTIKLVSVLLYFSGANNNNNNNNNMGQQQSYNTTVFNSPDPFYQLLCRLLGLKSTMSIPLSSISSSPGTIIQTSTVPSTKGNEEYNTINFVEDSNHPIILPPTIQSQQQQQQQQPSAPASVLTPISNNTSTINIQQHQQHLLPYYVNVDYSYRRWLYRYAYATIIMLTSGLDLYYRQQQSHSQLRQQRRQRSRQYQSTFITPSHYLYSCRKYLVLVIRRILRRLKQLIINHGSRMIISLSSCLTSSSALVQIDKVKQLKWFMMLFFSSSSSSSYTSSSTVPDDRTVTTQKQQQQQQQQQQYQQVHSISTSRQHDRMKPTNNNNNSSNKKVHYNNDSNSNSNNKYNNQTGTATAKGTAGIVDAIAVPVTTCCPICHTQQPLIPCIVYPCQHIYCYTCLYQHSFTLTRTTKTTKTKTVSSLLSFVPLEQHCNNDSTTITTTTTFTYDYWCDECGETIIMAKII